MKNRTWKTAGVLGGILMLSASAGTLVHAEEMTSEVIGEQTADSVPETYDLQEQSTEEQKEEASAGESSTGETDAGEKDSAENGTGEAQNQESAWANKAAADVNSYANVRAEASVEAEKAGVLPKGAAADVIEQQGEWTKIVSGEVEGYVKTELLAFSEEGQDLYESTYGNQGTVTASSLRIRSTPSLEGEVVGAKPQGSQVTLIGQEGDWYQVDLGEAGQAYMFAEYIEIEENRALTMEEYQAKLEAEEEQRRREQEQQEAASQASAQASGVSVSGSELDLLAAIIQCEAGGESHTGKVAVGAVIMNRVRSSQFPNSITEVVYQSGQFSPVASGILSSVLSQGARSDCYAAAQEALNGSNPVGGALYFNSGSGKGIQIGNQHFY